MVGQLEAMYPEMFDGHDIVWSTQTHVSRFAELLLAMAPGLLKGLSDNKSSVVFDSSVQNNTQNT